MSDTPKQADPESERVWEQGWDGHKRLQMQRMARLTMAQKLEWLEEAHHLVLKLKNKQSSREAFEKVLDKVPNVPPVKGDELQ